jgi:hypothetical protein
MLVDSAKSIVAAQFHDDNFRRVRRKGFGNARKTTPCGLPADTRVDHAVIRLALPQTSLKQAHPALFQIDAVGGAQAVAEHEDDALRFRRRCQRARQQGQREANQQHPPGKACNRAESSSGDGRAAFVNPHIAWRIGN